MEGDQTGQNEGEKIPFHFIHVCYNEFRTFLHLLNNRRQSQSIGKGMPAGLFLIQKFPASLCIFFIPILTPYI